MSFTIYRSTDASPPVLNGTAGSLRALLLACLVDGYGAKAAAGWAETFNQTVVKFTDRAKDLNEDSVTWDDTPLAPSRLSDVENSAYFKKLCQDNFEVLAEEIGKRLASYQIGSPTTILDPPTSGTRVVNEFWRDALGGDWVCTVTGSPGTWSQIRPAAVTADPPSGTIPTGYLV